MRTFTAIAGALVLALGGVIADEVKQASTPAKSTDASKPLTKPTLPKGEPAEQVKTLLRQYDEAAADFHKRYTSAVSEAEQERLLERYHQTGVEGLFVIHEMLRDRLVFGPPASAIRLLGGSPATTSDAPPP
jgi:hypothetical protein